MSLTKGFPSITSQEENIMRKKSVVFYMAILFVFAMVGLTQFTENVRTVQIVGLFSSGAAFGVCLAMIFAAFGLRRSRQ